jgi:hypothetical protein
MEQSYPQDLALFAELHDEATASRGAAVGDGEAVTGVVAESLDTPTIARGWRAMVGKDEVVIDGGGQVATAHWRASWSECVRRFWVRHDIVRDSGTECDRYRLVVDDGKDTRNAAVLADLGSEENALALLGQIHAGVSRALEMPVWWRHRGDRSAGCDRIYPAAGTGGHGARASSRRSCRRCYWLRLRARICCACVVSRGPALLGSMVRRG